jgi:hypothetical protein
MAQDQSVPLHLGEQLGRGGLLEKAGFGQAGDRRVGVVKEDGQNPPDRRRDAGLVPRGIILASHRVSSAGEQEREVVVDEWRACGAR